MILRKITFGQALIGLAFLLAFGLRFFQIGNIPLSDGEANQAMQALNLANGNQPQIGSQPGYVIPTSALFFVFGSSEFFARFWPAIFGSLLVLAPYLFREKLGKYAVIVLAFGLAIDPGLVAVSRQASGNMIVLCSFMLAAGFHSLRKPALAGIFLAIAFLNGTNLWIGLLPIGIVLLLHRLFPPQKQSQDELPNHLSEEAVGEYPVKSYWRTAILWGAGTLILVGTMFFMVPPGLSAAFTSIPEYLRGWVEPNGVYIIQFILGILISSPLALVFGLVEAIQGFRERDRLDGLLFLWWIIGLIVSLLYPSHQVVDIAWIQVPIWALAARQLVRHRAIFGEHRMIILGYGILVIVFLIFTWLNVTGLTNPAMGNVEIPIRWLGILGSMVILVFITILVVWSWSQWVAGSGLSLGIGCLLLFATLATGWRSAGLTNTPDAELWRISPMIAESDLLVRTIGDVSEANTGRRDFIDIFILNVDSPALKWTLRNDRNVTYNTILTKDSSPSLVITDETQQPDLQSVYSGQDFVWQQYPSWSLVAPAEWLRWVIYREIPKEKQGLILWVRQDLFPAATGIINQ